MRRNGKCFVQAGPRGSSCAAAASQRSLARRGGREFSVRLPVLRFALVILCLPSTDGSEPFTGCQEHAADDFFSTDLSSDLFPHNDYDFAQASGLHPTQPVPDEMCDLTIYPGFEADLAYVGIAFQTNLAFVIPWLYYRAFHLPETATSAAKYLQQTICVQPGTCEWPPFEPRSHLNLRIR